MVASASLEQLMTMNPLLFKWSEKKHNQTGFIFSAAETTILSK